MPHISESMEESDSYSDMEVQHITATAQSTDVGGIEFDYLVDPLDGDLDANEVAELVYYQRRVSMNVNQDGSELGDASSARGEFGFGINLPNIDSHLLNRTNDGDTLQPNDGGSGQMPVNTVDDAGILDAVTVSVAHSFEDTSQGTGAGAEYSEPAEREIQFGQIFGHGPYVDRTDELSLGAEINNYGIENGRVDLHMDVQLAFATYEVEGGRAEFAPPSQRF